MKSNTSLSNFGLHELFLAICHDLQGLCLEDVAIQAECHHTTLRNWREGKVLAPRINTIIRVAHVLGYNIEWYKS